MIHALQLHYNYTTPMHFGVRLTRVSLLQCALVLCTPSPPPPLIFTSPKKINSKHSLTFFTFYITSTISYYYLNKKTITIQNFSTFPYKFFLLYITSITFNFYSTKNILHKGRGGEGNY
jgi:hypothetical protein